MFPQQLEVLFKQIWDEVWHQPKKTGYAVKSAFSDNFLLHISSLETPLNKQQFIEFVPNWQKAFLNGRMEILNLAVYGNQVWCYWKSTGIHREEYLGIPATGKSVNYKGVDIWSFAENGQVDEAWAVPDVFSLMRQLDAI